MRTITDFGLGPLNLLIGTWKGNQGTDIAPLPNGTETNVYHETLSFVPVGEIINAESQKLSVVRYTQRVWRKTSEEIIHDQVGYWMWERDTGLLMHGFSIPRGVSVLAMGRLSDMPQNSRIEMAVSTNALNGAIMEAPFMQKNARTVDFSQTLTVHDYHLTYAQTTMVDIYGKIFEHTDRNELTYFGEEP